MFDNEVRNLPPLIRPVSNRILGRGSWRVGLFKREWAVGLLLIDAPSQHPEEGSNYSFWVLTARYAGHSKRQSLFRLPIAVVDNQTRGETFENLAEFQAVTVVDRLVDIIERWPFRVVSEGL